MGRDSCCSGGGGAAASGALQSASQMKPSRSSASLRRLDPAAAGSAALRRAWSGATAQVGGDPGRPHRPPPEPPEPESGEDASLALKDDPALPKHEPPPGPPAAPNENCPSEALSGLLEVAAACKSTPTKKLVELVDAWQQRKHALT